MLHSKLVDTDLTTRRVRVDKGQVVYVKGIFEASLGIGAMFSDEGDEFVLATPHCRARELDELLTDLQDELGSSMTMVESAKSDRGN